VRATVRIICEKWVKHEINKLIENFLLLLIDVCSNNFRPDKSKMRQNEVNKNFLLLLIDVCSNNFRPDKSKMNG
jgi:hypothetical protein